MHNLGLITARGGSKGIPQKNVVKLLGKPLLGYTCEAALASGRLTRVVLDTDDEAIADVGRSYGVEIPYLRPPELARDDTLHLEVIQNALRWFGENQDYRPDVVVLLQPTSPLRRSEHIDGVLTILYETDADTVVSVVEVPHHFSPDSVMQLTDDGNLSPFQDGTFVSRRQDKLKVFARNGPAVLAIRREVIERGALYGEAVRPFLMDPFDSIDIDQEEDLAMAEFWLNRRKIIEESH